MGICLTKRKARADRSRRTLVLTNGSTNGKITPDEFEDSEASQPHGAFPPTQNDNVDNVQSGNDSTAATPESGRSTGRDNSYPAAINTQNTAAAADVDSNSVDSGVSSRIAAAVAMSMSNSADADFGSRVAPLRSLHGAGPAVAMMPLAPKTVASCGQHRAAASATAASVSASSARPSSSHSLRSHHHPHERPYLKSKTPSPSRRRPPMPTRECRSVSFSDSDGCTQLNQYLLHDQIGKGSYGIVKLAYNKDDENLYAMKVLSKKRLRRSAGFIKRPPPRDTSANSKWLDPLQRVYREIAIQKKLDHPNVVKLVEVLDDPDHDNLYMVFEFVDQFHVMDIPNENPLSEERARRYIRDCISGLEYLHYQKIIHRDIKPSNLLLTSNDRIKIADFGVSNEFDGEDVKLSGTQGSPAFFAPESVCENVKNFSGRALDIWALGITLFCFLYGKVPFDKDPKVALYHSIVNDSVVFEQDIITTEEFKDLVNKMLIKDPSQRITLEGMKEHSWITQHGEEAMPTMSDNCQILLEVTEEEVDSCIKLLPKLETLILVKSILRNKSFRHPYQPHDLEPWPVAVTHRAKKAVIARAVTVTTECVGYCADPIVKPANDE